MTCLRTKCLKIAYRHLGAPTTRDDYVFLSGVCTNLTQKKKKKKLKLKLLTHSSSEKVINTIFLFTIRADSTQFCESSRLVYIKSQT